jgi:ribosomal protein S27AE
VVVSAVRAHLGFGTGTAGRVADVTRPVKPASRLPDQSPAQTAAAAAAFLDGQEITTTNCRRCGTEISGINGRYACGPCGWTNDWSEGHTALPPASEDPDA